MEKVEDLRSNEIQIPEERYLDDSTSIPTSDIEGHEKLDPEVFHLNVLLTCKTGGDTYEEPDSGDTYEEPDIFPKHLSLDEKMKDEVRNVFSQKRLSHYPHYRLHCFLSHPPLFLWLFQVVENVAISDVVVLASFVLRLLSLYFCLNSSKLNTKGYLYN